jgi:hypothetical protein
MIKQLLPGFSNLLRESNATSNFFKTLTVIAVLLLGDLTTGNAQLIPCVKNDYTFTESTGNAYADITGGTTIFGPSAGSTLLNVANFTTSYPIGFNFIYNNIQYTDVYISDNGYIFFKSPIGVTPTPAVTVGAGLSSATAYEGAVSGYGASLTAFTGEAGEVSYVTTGTPGSQVFTVQFKNLRRYDGVSTHYAGLLNFQIKLREIDNSIEVLYKDFTTAVTTNFTGQVGLRGPSNAFATTGGPGGTWTGSNINNRMNNGANPQFVASAAGTANTSSLITRFLTGTVYGPAPGTLFRWAPCFNPTNLVANLQGDNITVNMTWTAALYTPGGNTYQWEVRTSGLPGSGATGLYDSGTTTGTSASTTSLVTGQLYNFYVRSSCKGGAGAWTQYITSSVTPSCSTPLGVPYFQNFETAVNPNIPLCTTNTPATGAVQTFVVKNNNTGQPNAPLYGFTSKNLITGGTNAYPTGSVAVANTWWFSQPIALATGGNYRLTYTYGSTREQAFFTQKMKVGYGTSPAAGSMTILVDHPSIKTSPNTFSMNFTVATGGTYYLGFNGYAAANNGFLQVDNVALENTVCFPPTGITANPVGTNTATLNWTEPATNPTYEYYLSTTNTAPGVLTAPTGTGAAGSSLSLIGLTSSTTYYVWVRSTCTAPDKSQWSVVTTFTTAAQPCTPAPTSVDGTGITNVTFGSINNTTGDEPGHYGNYSAMSNYASQTVMANVAITFNTATFNYNTRIWIDWNNNGSFADTDDLVYTGLSASTSPNTLNASFMVPISVTGVANTAGPHRMRIGGADIDTLAGFGAGQGPCYNGAFGTFEDYTIFVVPPPPPLAIQDTAGNTSVTYCSAGPGNTSPTVNVTTGAASFDSFTWAPTNDVTGSIGSGWVFNPTVTTTYTLTASKLVAGVLYINTATYVVNVNQSPTAISITPSPASYCEGDLPVKLTATGGILSGATVFNETFNGSTTFTTVHNSVNGANAASLGWWLPLNSPFTLNPVNSTDSGTISSNDNSGFYMSDSDAQGSGGTTDEELISPTFSLVGYTDANLSFWHFYRGFVNGSAKVEISTNGGGTWTTLPGATWTTVTQGAPQGFVNVVLSLAAYATPGNTNNNMKIRFKYQGNWAWRWAVDNVKVTGSAVSNSVWSPNNALYTDINGTVPYDGVTPYASIYAKPSTTTVYTASVTSVASCVRTQTVTVNVTNLSGGTAVGNQSLTCGATPTAISVSGFVPAGAGNITGWQQAFNTAFTGATIVPGSAGQTTLTLGPVGTTTYYRAVILGCNTTYSNYVTITVTGANTFNSGVWSLGSFTPGDAVIVNAGTWTVSANTNVCSIQVRAGANVVVNSGVTLTVDNSVNVVTGGSLTFNDGASLLQDPATTTNANTGNIIYKRNSKTVHKFDYTYWSSPVDLQTMSGIFTAPQQPLADKYFWFNTTAYQWTQIAVPSITPMDIGKGYIIRGPQSFDPTPNIINATFTGTPNNGNYNVNIVKTGANDLNCIGNPYPSAVSCDAFVAQNAATFTDTATSVVGTTFYFWTHNTPINAQYQYNNADYATYNISGATITANPGAPGANSSAPNGYIAAGQSVMIRGIKNGTNVATFTNSMRSGGTNNGQFFRTQNQNDHLNNQSSSFSDLERNRIWLNLTNSNNNFKQILVGYIENATNGYENGYDGEVLEAGNPMTLYSIVGNDNKKLTIQGRALPFQDTDQVPLGFATPQASNCTIELGQFDGLFEDESVKIYLEDKLLNVIHDLRQGSYAFVSEAGTFDDRFVLRYNNTTLTTNPFALNGNAVIAYKSNNDIHVETSNIDMKSVKIYDVRGRLLLAKDNINGRSALFASPGIANQVLVIEVTSTDGITVNKKIIF